MGLCQSFRWFTIRSKKNTKRIQSFPCLKAPWSTQRKVLCKWRGLEKNRRLVVRLFWFQAAQAPSIRSHLLSQEKNLKGHLPKFKSVIIIVKLLWFGDRELRQAISVKRTESIIILWQRKVDIRMFWTTF